MTTDSVRDAREAAWRAHLQIEKAQPDGLAALDPHSCFDAGFEWGRTSTEQRYEALVEAARVSLREMKNAGWRAADHVAALDRALLTASAPEGEADAQ